MTGAARPATAPDSRIAPRRDLAVAAATIVGLSRFAEGPLVWVVAAILLLALLVGTLQVLADWDPAADVVGVPVEALLTPSAAGIASLGAIRLVPIGLALVPALVLVVLLVDRTLRTEARILAASRGPTAADRSTLLVQALVVAFLGFVGAAALVPGGLPEPGAGDLPGGPAAMSESNLLLLAAADAVIAGLLGYRASALRVTTLRDALWSAATYASAVAIGAAALRALDIPRLIGPAVLTLVFFLWDGFHGASPSRRRDPRWIWQTAVLVLVGVAVVAWNLGLR
ncbi:MAG TPA: hypothetical protein VKA85_02395 [Candidatus Limnocylindrales bacterium]|nr:hypothetical protein [Candidatus Limnocylindrales bacterium]